MSDAEPTPDDDREPAPAPSRPTRGAGWDDDEWRRRDLGPRPHVPDHGRRPFLVGLPILLITIAAVLAILVAGCGDDDGGDDTPAAGATSPAGDGSDRAAQALAESGPTLGGLAIDPELYARTDCEPTDAATDYRCTYGPSSGGGEPQAMRVRLGENGTITKILGSEPPTPGQKTSAQTQALLIADDTALGATDPRYVCATSTPVTPNGANTGGTTAGQRCVRVKRSNGKDVPDGQRYVEFAADGTVSKDFALPDDAADGE